MSELDVFVSITGSQEQLDKAYVAAGIRPSAGRITHASRALLLTANKVFGKLKGAKKSQMGVCLSMRNAADESYTGFRNSLIANDVMPRHYAASVPNAPTSELSLRHQLRGPVVTVAEVEGEVVQCPQVLLANDWLSTSLAEHVMIGTLEIDKQIDQSRCSLVVLDRSLAAKFISRESLAAPAPSGFALLEEVAMSIGLTRTKVQLT